VKERDRLEELEVDGNTENFKVLEWETWTLFICLRVGKGAGCCEKDNECVSSVNHKECLGT